MTPLKLWSFAYDATQMWLCVAVVIDITVKQVFSACPLFRISWPWHLCENNGLQTLLSAQCNSSIGQIIKFSLCVCESVSESVTQNELNALQIAIFHRSSPNLPPRRCGYLLCFVEIQNISIRQTEVELILTIAPIKISLISSISKTVRDTM